MRRRVVVKVGSALLTPQGPLGPRPFERLAAQVHAAHEAGVSVTLVSSGAIAQGRLALHLAERPAELSAAQALAAVGQPLLMRRWAEAFAALPRPLPVAQFLLTRSDVEEPLRFFNARRALRALERLGAVAIGNENDTVATEEIKIGDNDTLAAHVARVVGADLLVIYTQVDGLYTGNPERDSSARRVPLVGDIAAVESFAGEAGGDGWGVGGMRTKVEAARVATRAGVSVVIAHGRAPLLDLLHNAEPLRAAAALDGTLFVAPLSPAEALKARWPLSGRLTLTQEGGARLCAGEAASLAHLLSADGEFARGDLVELCVEGAPGPLGRALTAYGRAECLRALGGLSLGGAFDGPLVETRDWAR